MTREIYFQRFTAPDESELLEQIEAVRSDLQLAEKSNDPIQILECVGVLGSLLTTARKEEEARELLLAYLPLAQEHATSDKTGWFLLALATANQYLDFRQEANAQFEETLTRARDNGWDRLEHFVLHHWGRFLVEEGKLAQARGCFEEALRLREMMNEPFQESTRRALATMDDFERP